MTSKCVLVTMPCLFLLTFTSGCDSKASSQKTTKEPPLKSDVLKEGERLYYMRDCVRCHGFKGDGRSIGMGIKKPPRNFSDLNAYKQGTSLEAITHTLQVGITNQKTAMPVYSYLSEEKRKALATYVLFLREKYASNHATNQNP